MFAALQEPKWHTPVTAFSPESTPPGTPRKQWTLEDINKELYGKLRKGGLKLNMGPEGRGLSMPVLEKVGGHWWDSGAADMIADGLIQVKSGTSPERFTETGLAFGDGTQLAADAIIFATGYQPIMESVRELLGEDISRLVGDISGLDEEGQMKASYRPTGHPGLWFATGDIFVSRFYSKILALQIKARQLHDSLWNSQPTTTVVLTAVSPMDILCQSLDRLALSETTGAHDFASAITYYYMPRMSSLTPDDNYNAFMLMMELFDLPGHEEQGTLSLRDDRTDIPGKGMQNLKEFANWVKANETEPYALIGTMILRTPHRLHI
ncbi:hypothetical protein NUW54_g308 [Trametes sanguinea]|uniref:Uncharacterized protein n=1 Tax=Trametes sanguinea TaxID=158606 RepID=A0ACC1QBE3_9APHY|nr:hypothetical protein NUW54_g308 [Trametes sanguinea]